MILCEHFHISFIAHYFSSKLRLLGAPGEDNVVKVPLGICVKTDRGQILGNVNIT